MEQALDNIANKKVLLIWNNAHSSSCVQETVTKLKERIGEGHLSLEHVERLQLGNYWNNVLYVNYYYHNNVSRIS